MYKSIKELFTAIADELRERLDIEGKIPTQDMPQRVQDLYFTSFNNGRDTGESIGYIRGYSEGEIKGRDQGLTVGNEQGKAEVYAQIEPINAQLENTLNGTDTGGKSYYDEFWDSYLTSVKNGSTSAALFAGRGWTDATFNPPEFIDYIDDGFQLFIYASNISKEKLRMIDYSKLWRFQGTFNSTLITEIPVIDTRGSTEPLSSVFAWTASLISIEKLILKADGSQEFRGTFEGCSSLIEITIEGVIGQDGFNVRWSTKLSKASIISIINALSTTTSGKSVTLSKVAVESAFGSTASEEWISLINARSNWTINLV